LPRQKISAGQKKPVDIAQAAPEGAPSTAFYIAKGYRPEDSVGYLMRQILSTVAHQVEQQLAHADLTNAQGVPLFAMYMGEGSTGATTRLLDRLEAKGLCSRVRSKEDRRGVNTPHTRRPECGLTFPVPARGAGQPMVACLRRCPALAAVNAAGMSTEQALSQINRMVDQQAYMLAANDVFLGSALIFVLRIPCVWIA
jgi:hypothetical protein